MREASSVHVPRIPVTLSFTHGVAGSAGQPGAFAPRTMSGSVMFTGATVSATAAGAVTASSASASTARTARLREEGTDTLGTWSASGARR